jgi:hypothetical protein
MDQGVAIRTQDREVLHVREPRLVCASELLPVMNLKHSDTLATEEFAKIYLTCLADILCQFQRTIAQRSVTPT